MAKLKDIYIQNNLTRTKEKLIPLEEGVVKMYACGVTVYDHCHIGHALQAIYFDVMRRYLEFAGYRVTYVRNYTDVDDKIIDKAKSLNKNPRDLAEEIIASSEHDMHAIGVRKPDFSPRVSQSIPQIIAMVQQLIEGGSAYKTSSGDVYFRVRSKNDYGKLSNRKPDDMRTGTREIAEGDKEDPLDFALWKIDTTPGASWPSPWGTGRPGWHIECSAMSLECLGKSFDIHGGGRDLIFPHHENEIAQSECANHAPYATFWVHCGLLTIDKQKMSKSLGNHILIKDFLKQWPAEVLRLSFLQHHYGSNIDFNQDIFQKNRSRLFYYYNTLMEAVKFFTSEPADLSSKIFIDTTNQITKDFHRHMSDDFNSAAAIASMNVYFKKLNQLLKQKKTPHSPVEITSLSKGLTTVFKVLGLLEHDPEHFIAELKSHYLSSINMSEKSLGLLIDERTQAKQNKDFVRADQIRKELSEKGIDLMDGANGTNWGIKDDAI